VGRAVRALKALLPGVSSGTLCFQELVALYRYHVDRPPGEREGDRVEAGEGVRGGSLGGKEGRGKEGREGRGREGRGEEGSAGVDMDGPGGVDGMGRGWQLPFRSSVLSLAAAAAALPPWAVSDTTAKGVNPKRVAEEFRRLDITGDGRLTYMNLKTALGLREVAVDDVTVKRWMRENDRGGKGYVDFSDYQAIYDAGQDEATHEASNATGPTGTEGFTGVSGSTGTVGFAGYSGRGRGGREARDASTYFAQGTNAPGSRRYGSLEAVRPSPERGTSTHPAGRPPPLDRERLALLRRAFDRYDVDGDGAISVDDLQLAFAAQGRPPTDPLELVTWVRRRDSTGVGLYVTFEDFCTHYQ
jgi:Ca2+-binding EF-hand superfamily protein